jgi:ABC-type transport system substrate-binding protein
MPRHRMASMSCAFVPAGLVALVTLLVSTLGAGAATARHMMAGPVRGGTLLIGYPTDMTTFDPAQAYSSDWQVVRNPGRKRLGLCRGPRPWYSSRRKSCTSPCV